MAAFPYYRHFPRDYLADTRHFTATEHGSYRLLLDQAWLMPGCALPNDNASLRKWAGSPKNWPSVKATVMALWTLGPDGLWRQKRQIAEYEWATQSHTRQAANGSRRWLKNQETINATAKPWQCQPEAEERKIKNPPLPPLAPNQPHASPPADRQKKKDAWRAKVSRYARLSLSQDRFEAWIALILRGGPDARKALNDMDARMKANGIGHD